MDRLLHLLQRELQRIARRHLARERKNHTMQPVIYWNRKRRFFGNFLLVIKIAGLSRGKEVRVCLTNN
jgi:hypothetical protein